MTAVEEIPSTCPAAVARLVLFVTEVAIGPALKALEAVVLFVANPQSLDIEEGKSIEECKAEE